MRALFDALKVGIGGKLKSLDRGTPVDWMDPPLTVEDRFVAAARDGDRRYDAAMRLAKDRGRIAAGAVAVTALLAAGWWWEAQKPMVETVFIPFNQVGDPGEVFVTRAETPPDLVRVAAAEAIIKAMFSLSSDGNVNADNQKIQEQTLRGQARERFDAWVRATDDSAEQRQIVIVSSKQRAGDVINVIWDEFDWKGGRKVASRRQNGDFTLSFVAPRKVADIVANKTGLFLVNMLFAEERS